MKKNKSLLISLIIFVISVILVVSIGTIPLPDYESNMPVKGLEGKIIFQYQLVSRNLLPPAPDILDDCIYAINLEIFPYTAAELICSSDLNGYSNEFYWYDAFIIDNSQISIKYWDRNSNIEKELLIDIETKNIVTENTVEKHTYNEQNKNLFGEILIDAWQSSNQTREVAIYYQLGSEIFEVFKSKAPTNYYFNTLKWSPDGENIIASDSENNLILFSKSKLFNPNIINFYIENIENKEFIRLIGWSS